MDLKIKSGQVQLDEGVLWVRGGKFPEVSAWHTVSVTADNKIFVDGNEYVPVKKDDNSKTEESK